MNAKMMVMIAPVAVMLLAIVAVPPVAQAAVGYLSDSTGEVVAWGYNPYGQTTVPAGTFVAIAAGHAHSLGIKSDGTVAGWGATGGEVPGGVFTAVSAGAYFSLGIKGDGTLAGWGNNDYGQSTVPGGIFTAVATGANHGLGIKSDGTLAGWGWDLYGQATVPAGYFMGIAAGATHSLGVKIDGTLAGWGNNASGEANVPGGIFTAVAAGDYHSLGIRGDGTLAGWGDNSFGQTSVPAGQFMAVATGNCHSLGIRDDGTLAGWGDNSYGQATVPEGVFTAIAAGAYHSLALRARTDYDGDLRVCGSGAMANLTRSVTVAGNVGIDSTMVLYNNPTMGVAGKMTIGGGAGISGNGAIQCTGALELPSGTGHLIGSLDLTVGGLRGAGNLNLSGTRLTVGDSSLFNGALGINSGWLAMSGSGNGLTPAAVLVGSAGELRVAAGQRLVVGSGASFNAGSIQVIGSNSAPAELEFAGAVTNYFISPGIIDTRNATVRFGGGLTNEGALTVSPGVSDIYGDIANTGSIIVTGGATGIFHDDIVQNGSLRVSKVGSTTSVAVFYGSFSGSGGFTGGGDVFLEGDLRPGSSPANVTMGGNVFLGDGSRTVMELTGTTMGSQYDHVTVTGGAALGGALEVQALSSYRPREGDKFTVISTGGGITGDFSTVSTNLTGGNAGFDGGLNGNDYVVEFTGWTNGDAGGDGAVDTSDLNAMTGSWFQIGTYAWANGDFTGDGVVDTSDLNAMTGDWWWTKPSPAPDQPIPEPTSLALLALSGLALIRRRRE